MVTIFQVVATGVWYFNVYFPKGFSNSRSATSAVRSVGIRPLQKRLVLLLNFTVVVINSVANIAMYGFQTVRISVGIYRDISSGTTAKRLVKKDHRLCYGRSVRLVPTLPLRPRTHTHTRVAGPDQTFVGFV